MTALVPAPDPVPLAPADERRMVEFDRHGAVLHQVASVLTRTSDRADRLVISTILRRRRRWLSWIRTPGSDARSIVEDLYLSWVRDDLPRSVAEPAVERTLREDLHRLTDAQLGALALCAMGGHTYRQAARVMGISPVSAALDLRSALNALVA